MLFFGDMLQIPPIPPSSALFQPPPKETESATTALEMFWTTSEDSINMFTELTEQWRIDDDWYQAFLCQCRVGALTDEMYNYFL